MKTDKGEEANLGTTSTSGRKTYYDQAFYDNDSRWETRKFDGRLQGCGSVVYSVAIGGSGSNGIPSAGDHQKWVEPSFWNSGSDGSSGSKINEYLYRVSSHRPDGSHVGYDKYNEWETVWENWTRRYPDDLTRNRPEGSYYCVGSTSEIEKIFTSIAQQTGTKIENAVVRDYITPGFVPCDANGNAYTVGQEITSANGKGVVKQDTNGCWYIEWTNVELNPGDTSGNNKKMFNETIYVKPHTEFWGGNKVPTNIGNISAVYDDNGNNIGSFPIPEVDVALKVPEITGNDYNVYYGGAVPSADELYNDFTPGEGWKTAFVEIGSYTVDTGSVSNEEDSAHNISVTVEPRLVGTITDGVTKNAAANVKVFKPVASFKDSTIYLSNTPNYENNKDGLVWKHGDEAANHMYGTEPEVTYSYDKPADAFENCTEVEPTISVKGKTPAGQNYKFTVHVLKPTIKATDIWANYDTDVDLGVWSVVRDANNVLKVTDWTDSTHSSYPMPVEGDAPAVSLAEVTKKTGDGKLTGLNYKTGADDSDFDIRKVTINGKTFEKPNFTVTKAVDGEEHDFTVHINHFDLKVTKTVTSGDTSLYGNTFVFTVKDGNDEIVEFVLGNGDSKTITGLLCGKTYTVSEDTNWSWRYTADNSDVPVLVGKDHGISNTEVKTCKTEVTVNNSLTEDKWLTDEKIIPNTFTSVLDVATGS